MPWRRRSGSLLTIVYPRRMTLTDEQRDFAESIRDFSRRECGTRERRLELTDGGADTHSPELHAKMAELGWLGVAIPEDYGGIRRLAGRPVRPLRGDEPRHDPGLRESAPPRLSPASTSTSAARSRSKRSLGGISEGKVCSISISEPEAGSDVSNVSCKAVRDNGSLRDQRPEDVVHRGARGRHHARPGADEQGGEPARRPDADRGPGRRRGRRGPRDRDDGRPRGQRRLPHRCRRARGERRRGARSRVQADHGRARRRAA